MRQKSPVGNIAIIVDHSTKGWKEFRCVGSLHFGNDITSLRVIPPGKATPSSGYPALVEVVDRNPILLHIKQKTGDRRMITILREVHPDGSVVWSFSQMVRAEQIGPLKIMMYPGLERLLQYLAK